MARYIDAIDLPVPVEEAFDYLAEFSRSVEWDPGVVEGVKLDPGPVRLGSRFRVVVSFLGRRMPLEYEITEYERPTRLVLRGGDDSLRSIDELSFVPRGRGCRVTYEARLELEGLRRVADPALQLLFQRIGRLAVAGLRERFRGRTAPESPAAQGTRARVGRALSRVLDPTILFSFDRTGFRVHSLAFREEDLEVDLTGRLCLVTGANSGIGYETSLGLAERGAELLLLCRSHERGERAAEQIRKQTGNPRVGLELVDVSDLASVRALVARLGSRPVDVLVHNAGTLPDQRVETAQGLELCFATHVAGPHLLTRLLRGPLEASSDGRVIWVSSGGMYTRRLNLRDPQWQEREYDGVLAYAETKRAQVVLSELWAEELRSSGVSVNSMHPGWADTPAVASSLPRFYRLTRNLLRTPAEGADTALWLAACPRAGQASGRFFFDREPRRTHLLPGTRESEEERRRLWRLCDELTSGA